VSATYEAVFTRCKSRAALQGALDRALAAETWPPKERIEVAEVQFSERGWAMLMPLDRSFFLERGDANENRLVRLARELGAPVYEVDVRGGSTVTLIEASADGALRVSGASLAQAKATTKDVGFGLLPVTDTIRERAKRLADDPRLADYLGELAGFPTWRRSPRDGEPLVFTAPASAPPRREPSVASSPPATPAPRDTRPSPSRVRRAPASPGRTTRRRSSSARGGRSR
jgi:hypothetical protein